MLEYAAAKEITSTTIPREGGGREWHFEVLVGEVHGSWRLEDMLYRFKEGTS
jgi:hypothetical protein